ncbi:hypothetical protein ACKWRH_10740 [Bradyrhizobium sp. Pa8]|uniref:hypothetical protein n=1 Tax=Bradyrhizobium sp. Pa8 TaxID=3386552 RepID=UPI00403FB83C
MDQAVSDQAQEADKHKGHDVAVAVITPVGIYPDEDDFRREPESTVIEQVLKAAAEKLKITNTSDWVAKVDGRKLDPHKTFKQEHLSGIVEIEYHKHEGGGGA